jgi:hypothetical protein
MKKILMVLFLSALCVLGGTPAAAQTPPAEPNAGDNFVVETGFSYASGIPGASSATWIGATVPLSNRWSFKYRQYVLPASGEPGGFPGAQLYLAGGGYSRNLGDLLKKTGSEQLSLNRIHLEAYALFGSKRDREGQDKRFAMLFGAKPTFRINDTLRVGVDIAWGRYGLREGTSFSLQQNHGQFSPLLELRF